MRKEIENELKKREKRVRDAVQLKEPDRVPIIPVMEHFPWYYAGYSVQDIMYDFSKAEDVRFGKKKSSEFPTPLGPSDSLPLICWEIQCGERKES